MIFKEFALPKTWSEKSFWIRIMGEGSDFEHELSDFAKLLLATVMNKF
jgi:hypothetical protein